MSYTTLQTKDEARSVDERAIYIASAAGVPCFIEKADDGYHASKTVIGLMPAAGVPASTIEQLTPFLFDAVEQMDVSGLLDVHVVVALADQSFFIAGFCRPPVPGDRVRESMLTLAVNYRGEIFDIAVSPSNRAISERAGMFGMPEVDHVH